MDVSIILVNYNTKQITSNCIDSIFAKTNSISFEVILIDNASSDGSSVHFRYDGRIKFIESRENIGFGNANNLGIKMSTGRNVLFLNTDTLLLNNAVKILSDFLDSNPKVGACGGNLIDIKSQPTKSFARFFPGFVEEFSALTGHRYERLRYGKNSYYNNSGKPIKVAFVSGADMMVKRQVLDRVGVFDKDFFLYFEETELSYRVYKYGYTIYSIPEAQLIHLVSKSFDFPESKARHYYFSKQVYYSKIYSAYKVCFLNALFCFHHKIRYYIALILKQDQIALSNKNILRVSRESYYEFRKQKKNPLL